MEQCRICFTEAKDVYEEYIWACDCYKKLKPKFYQVQARIVPEFINESVKELPTFILNGDQLGIKDIEHAFKFAKNMIENIVNMAFDSNTKHYHVYCDVILMDSM